MSCESFPLSDSYVDAMRGELDDIMCIPCERLRCTERVGVATDPCYAKPRLDS